MEDRKLNSVVSIRSDLLLPPQSPESLLPALGWKNPTSTMFRFSSERTVINYSWGPLSLLCCWLLTTCCEPECIGEPIKTPCSFDSNLTAIINQIQSLYCPFFTTVSLLRLVFHSTPGSLNPMSIQSVCVEFKPGLYTAQWEATQGMHCKVALPP